MSSLPPPSAPPPRSPLPPPPPPVVPITPEAGTHLMGGISGAPVPSPSVPPVESRPASKAPWIAAVAVVVALVAGAGVYLAVRSEDSAPKGSAYPQQVRENFLTSCGETSGGKAQYCGCVLTQLEQRYTIDEFLALEQRFVNGTAQGELDEVLAPCLGLLSP